VPLAFGHGTPGGVVGFADVATFPGWA
jgi:hypothetical protein